jgi:chromosome segregation ATPase
MSPTENDDLRELLDRRFTKIDAEFTKIEGQFRQIGRQFDEVARRFDSADRRTDGVQHQVTELRQEILGHFDELYRRLDRLEQEYFAISQALRRIEARLADEGARREVLERDLTELKQHVAALQVRIEDLEQRLGR